MKRGFLIGGRLKSKAMGKKATLATRKKDMVEALKSALGIVSIACKTVGMDRATHYRWLKDDPNYAEAVADVSEIALDFAESSLHKQIKDGDTTATIFYLKTKGKKRGYIEKQEIDLYGRIESNLNNMSNEQLDSLLTQLAGRKDKAD